jgi:hypothetical protein
MQQTLTGAEVQELTDYKLPKYQAKKLRELGYIVLGYSARGKVRALAERPAQATVKATDRVSLNL